MSSSSFAASIYRVSRVALGHKWRPVSRGDNRLGSFTNHQRVKLTLSFISNCISTSVVWLRSLIVTHLAGSFGAAQVCAPKIMQALQVIFSAWHVPNNFTPCDSCLPVGRDSRTTCQCRPASAGCHEGRAVVIESFRRGRGPSFSRQDSVGFII
jgi:hypothetical protein